MVVGLAIWGLVYVPFVNDCCAPLDTVLLLLFAPAIAIGSVVGGGFDRAGYLAALVGIIFEVAVVWAILRIPVRYLQRRKEGINDV